MNTILFDLDGTLLPISQKAFTDIYFGEIVKKVKPLGYEKDSFLGALWIGTKAMIKNDGQKTNHDLFWAEFISSMGPRAANLEDILDGFYANEFNNVKTAAGDSAWVAPLIKKLRAKGFDLVLATNPIFPAVAVKSRLDWLEITPDDFIYITTYENSSYCKPNPKYFQEILGKIGRNPDDCLMIGNSASEDMAALNAGIPVFLTTEYLENEPGIDISSFRRGNYKEMCEFLINLPDCSR